MSTVFIVAWGVIMAYINLNGELRDFHIYNIKTQHRLAETIERKLRKATKKITSKIEVKRLEIINLINGLIVTYEFTKDMTKTRLSFVYYQNSGLEIDDFLKFTFFITDDLSFATDGDYEYCEEYTENFVYKYSQDLELYTRIIATYNQNEIITYLMEIIDIKFIDSMFSR